MPINVIVKHNSTGTKQCSLMVNTAVYEQGRL